ncbi:MAG: toxic anion resistance protein [Lachnospiraceae bacterium]|nr:toxic anion resistance protein [Lachnospiraceae bacterium]
MSEIELKTEAPTLVFDMPEVKSEIDVVKTDEIEAPKDALDDSMLSEEEKKMVSDFAGQIDLRNTDAVLRYGAGTQKKMADFSDKALDNIRAKDMGEVGDMLSGLVTELKSFDVSEDAKGITAFFKKKANKITSLKAKYDEVETSVESIAKKLEGHQITLIKDANMLDKMYEMNLAYFKELSMYIIAGKKKLEEARNGELVELRKKAEQSGLAEDAQAAKDFENLCERFDKKLYDLELTRNIALQTAPQIRLVQNSNTVMAEKIQSTIVNTIPLWKNQMVIALGVEHATKAAAAERKVNDMTNELLKKNAANLKVATIESAKEAERGIVDIETLKQTNETLISTIDEVIKIQNEGREKRRLAEAELANIEGTLKNKLLEAAR